MTGTVVYKPLASVTPSDRLARDVHDEHGGVLASSGCAVDDRIRRRLQLFGVASVPVGGVEDGAPDPAGGSSLDDTLNHLFRHWRLSPGMNNLRALIANHRGEAASR